MCDCSIPRRGWFVFSRTPFSTTCLYTFFQIPPSASIRLTVPTTNCAAAAGHLKPRDWEVLALDSRVDWFIISIVVEMTNQQYFLPKKSSMRELLAAMKAFADENRLRIVSALSGRELCLCQLVELLGLATSTVSRHMSILHQARLVVSRKEGRWTYFRLDEDAPIEVAAALDADVAGLRRDSVTREDAKRLKEILRLDPEALCRTQSECKG